MTLEIAEDGEPSGLPFWLEIITSVDTAMVMPLLWIMFCRLRMHLTKPLIQRIVSQRVSRVIARKGHAQRVFF
jgi:hypothetical protein